MEDEYWIDKLLEVELYCDGVRDDSRALNKLFSGKSIKFNDEWLTIDKDGISFENVIFKLDSTIIITTDNVNFYNCIFDCYGESGLIFDSNATGLSLYNCTIERAFKVEIEGW